ncbi:MAG: monothiol glutaredoxin, Grx4 family, partial [Lysobacter sp.]|nr:monothiol glutaredoxin, Grx4 family [Lysobacter sp.]
LQLAPIDPQAIATEAEGLRVQFDLASAGRARGLSIDWVDDERGRGLVIDNPNAPPKVQPITATEAAERVRAGTLTLVDVRPAEERALASVNEPFTALEGEALAQLEALPKDTALAFLCHHGQRSAQAAERFRGLGFRSVYDVQGGIEAWSEQADPGVPRY